MTQDGAFRGLTEEQELVIWFQKYVQGFLEVERDLRNGLALIAFLETISGAKIKHCEDPKNRKDCQSNCKIALMTLNELYEGFPVVITASGKNHRT